MTGAHVQCFLYSDERNHLFMNLDQETGLIVFSLVYPNACFLKGDVKNGESRTRGT